MLEGAKSTGTTPRKKTRENQGGVDWRVGYGIKAATNIKKDPPRPQRTLRRGILYCSTNSRHHVPLEEEDGGSRIMAQWPQAREGVKKLAAQREIKRTWMVDLSIGRGMITGGNQSLCLQDYFRRKPRKSNSSSKYYIPLSAVPLDGT